MKLRATSYTFDKTAKTVVCSLFTSLEAIQLITNVTDNIIIYNFADATKGGTLSGTTLTLAYNTAAMDNADKLQIFIEDGSTTQATSGTVTANIGTIATLATATKQDTGNASVASVDTKTPALGQALAAASTPVVLTAAQVTTLTPPAAITGFATSAKQDTADTSINTLLKPASTLAAVTTVGTVSSITAIANALPAGTNAIGKLAANSGVDIGDVDVTTLPSVHFQDLYITGQGSQTTLNNNVILATAGTGSTDTLNGTTGISFRSLSFQLIPAAGTVTAGVITFEGSNDNTNFISIFLSDTANVTANPAATINVSASTNRYFTGAISFRYFRARISTGITGTTTGVQAFTVFSTIPFSNPRLTVSQQSPTSLNATVGTVSPGSAAANLGKAEDGAHTSGDVGVFALGVRADTLADVSGSTGDYIQQSHDLKGRLMVGSAPRDLKLNQVTTITASTAETTIVTAVASTFLDLYGLIVTNTSATAVTVAIKDATAGTTRLNIAVPAGDTRGFMLPIDAAIKQSAVNNNWTATTQSVTSVIITALTVSNV